MTYEELPNHENWHRKRLEIIRRDQNRCQECANQELLSMSKLGRLVDIPLVYQSDFSRKSNSTYSYKLDIQDVSSGSRHQTQIVKVFQDPLPNIWPLDMYFSSEVDLDSNERFFLNCIYNRALKDFVYVRGLQVHHTYYQDDRMPWDYPAHALHTLCWICHWDFHATQTVPWLDVNGRQKGWLTPCARCGGSGYLPQYYYYLNRICFRCSGAAYDEFIRPSHSATSPTMLR